MPTFPPATTPAIPPAYVTPQQPVYGSPPPSGTPPVPEYPAYGAPVSAQRRPTRSLAIASLICGIAGFLFSWAVVLLPASIAAVVTGHMALRQTKGDPSLGGLGLAVAGLIMGYVVIAMLITGVAIVMFGFLFLGFFGVPFISSS